MLSSRGSLDMKSTDVSRQHSAAATPDDDSISDAELKGKKPCIILHSVHAMIFCLSMAELGMDGTDNDWPSTESGCVMCALLFIW